MDRRRYLRAVATVGATLPMAGCTGDDPGDGTPTGAATPTDSPAPTETEPGTPTPSETPDPTPSATPPEHDQRVVVGYEGRLRFHPESFEIPAGGTVLWEWVDGGHNVKPEESAMPGGSDWTGTRGPELRTFDTGHIYWYTFEVPGAYDYYCAPHQSVGMRGSFTVTE